jgi:3-deoxy-D-manno-octulosonic-acid transferase
VLRYFRIPAGRPVLVAGSTMRGEEVLVLAAFRRLRATAATALLIVAPRHPERFDDVVKLCRSEGYKTLRRSTELAIDAEPRADVIVIDTIGELATLYQLATVVFVGGSLVPTGGHNILEPAVFGKPIVFGPYMDNFTEIVQTFRANHAAMQVPDDGPLDEVLVSLMTDPVRRARLGATARALVEANRGAKDRSLQVLSTLLPKVPTFPSNVRPFRPIA